MYVPSHFAETDVATLHAFIRAHPLGALVTLRSDGLGATHLPFELDPDPAPLGTLRGHIARANPQWRDHVPGVDALVVFQGANAYVTPSYYASKREHGKVVPTYNYAAVHANGPLRVIEDRTWLRALVGRLTGHFEAPRDKPWAVDDAPPAYVAAMLEAIVGIEVPIARLVGSFKASQNRTPADRAGVADGLAAAGDEASAAVAAMVRQRAR
jgi:transcriptional regulator